MDLKITVELEEKDRALLKAVGKALAAKGGKPAADEEPETVEEETPESEENDPFAVEPEPEDDGPTIEQVRTALKAYGTKASQKDALALLLKIGGVKTLGELKPAKFKAVIAAANDAAKKAKKK